MSGIYASIAAEAAPGATGAQLGAPAEPDSAVLWRFFRSLKAGRRADSRIVEVTAERVEEMAGEIADGETLILTTRLNHIRRINWVLLHASARLPIDGRLIVTADTLEFRKAALRRRYPRWLARILIFLDLLLRRVPSKLPILKHIYFSLTRGRGRLLSRTEVLGRIVSCGFRIERERKIGGVLHVAAVKIEEPRRLESPSYGPVFRMRRVGEHGRPIHVYKLRTMYPYAEFVQQYAYDVRRLAPGGKIRNDFRVTDWGRHARRLWLDELPMLLNWLRRDLKLVGVRPLSDHFLTLYPENLRTRRCTYRPGLIPPFYADLPRTFEEIVASEARYLDAYDQKPLRTDLRYFCRALSNIIFKRARSA